MSQDGDRIGPQHVLLVEDDALFRATLEEFLVKLGYHVITADNAETAWELYRQHGRGLHLLVTDICMPEPEDGIELVRKVRGDNADLPIVVATGYDEYQSVDATDRLHTMIYNKPFNFAQFHQYLEQIKD